MQRFKWIWFWFSRERNDEREFELSPSFSLSLSLSSYLSFAWALNTQHFAFGSWKLLMQEQLINWLIHEAEGRSAESTAQMEEEAVRCAFDGLLLRDVGVADAHSVQSDYDTRFVAFSAHSTPQDRLLVHRSQSPSLGPALGCFLSGNCYFCFI